VIRPVERDEPVPLPPRYVVRQQAMELLALAQRAVEFSGNGPTHDLQAALRQFERARALLGVGEQGGGETQQ